jgi:hypothetical protein
MARIKKDLANEREQYMLEIFKKNPKLSVAKANAQLQEKFGQMMRAQRAYEIRTIARKEVETSGSAQAVASAGRRVGKRKVAARTPTILTENQNKLMIIEGTGENIAFLQNAFNAMRESDFSVPVIDYQANGYAVIRDPQ